MPENPKENTSDERLQKQVALVVGVLVVLLAIWSLYSLYRPPDGARDFTRVGGKSRIETSIEAAHFWPRSNRIVMAPGWPNTREMPDAEKTLGAGVRAAQLDAPLLLAGNPLSKTMRLELKRWRAKSDQKNFCAEFVGFSAQSPILKALKKEVKPCPPSANDEPVTTSPSPVRLMPPVHLVAPHSAFLPPQLPSELVRHLAPEPSEDCDLRGKLLELMERWSSDPSERAADFRCSLPDTVVFATAQNYPDVPDIAVAIALAAHLRGPLEADQEKSSSIDQAVVVILPRYLDSGRGLERFLHERGTKVARGVVIGGPVAVSDDLGKQLRSVMALTNIGAIVQGSSNLIEKLGVVIGLLLALGVLGVGAATVAGAAAGTATQVIREWLPDGGEGAMRFRRTDETVTAEREGGKTSAAPEADATTATTETGTKTEGTGLSRKDPIAALRSVVNKYRGQNVWIRLRLTNEVWVAGMLEDVSGKDSTPSPFQDSEALWLTDVVECDPHTGDFRFSDDRREPLLRASALAVRREDIQLLEVVSRNVVNSMRNEVDNAQEEG